MTIPSEYNGKPVTCIGESAFQYASYRLTAVTLPDSITDIRDSAFAFCMSLTNVRLPESVTTIGDMAFSMCGMSTITIPDSVISIGSAAFDSCAKLTAITVGENNTAYVSIDGVLFNKNKTTLLCYPSAKTAESYTISDSVTVIGDSAFSGCESLQTLAVPEGVTQIGTSAFCSCGNLRNLNIPTGVSVIGDFAFEGTAWLKNQTQEYVVINNRFLIAYNGTSTEMKIPDGVTSISGNPQRESVNDEESIGILVIPDSLTQISTGVLTEYTISIFKVADGNPVYSSKDTVLFNKNKTKLIRFPRDSCSKYVVPEGVVTIGEYAFSNRFSMQSITLPNGITEIGENAFNCCSSLTDINIPNGVTEINENVFSNTALNTLVLPDSVTSIGDNAFYNCSQLKSITIPASVTFIGREAFAKCEKLKIYGQEGSAIQTYAKENKIFFKKQS